MTQRLIGGLIIWAACSVILGIMWCLDDVTNKFPWWLHYVGSAVVLAVAFVFIALIVYGLHLMLG